MVWLALAFLVIFTIIGVAERLPTWLRVALGVLQILIWAVFVIDLVVRLRFADGRWRWLATHPLDVLAVLWPAFRPLKILAVIGDARFRAGAAVVRTTRAVVAAAVLLIWVCSVAVLAAERGRPESSIETLGDAVWWAFATIATVGYGDMVPVTASGRVIGVILMVVGLALVAIITASIASWFVANAATGRSHDRDASERIAELEQEIDRLRRSESPQQEA